MRFLALTPGLAAALLLAVAGAVLLLYLLKPSPRRLIVSSTQLWRRVLRERKRTPEGAVHARRLRREVDGALEGGRRLVEVLPLLLNHAEDPVGRREVRVQLDRVVALLEGDLVVATVEMDHRQVPRHD